MTNSDLLHLKGKRGLAQTPPVTEGGPPWKLLVVDDDDEVHKLTRMVLEDYNYLDKPLEIISAYTGQEALATLQHQPDVAVILLDVVMETDDAGLKIANHIRNEMENRFVRIILRTGQPGAAPEKRVITEYDINDYKEKTELTSTKLYTSITTALRSYQDIQLIEQNRKGLKTIIDASKILFDLQSQEKFVSGLLDQISTILKLDQSPKAAQSSSISATPYSDDYKVLAATGKYAPFVGAPLSQVLERDELQTITNARHANSPTNILFTNNCYTGYFKSHDGSENLLFVKGPGELTPLDKNLIRIFSNNLAIAFDNFCLNHELIDTQREVILTLGEVVENRSKESANHVKRVAEYAKCLAIKAGLSEHDVDLIHMASPMHDVGKIAIPDAILNKPGQLTADEIEVMKSHARIGNQILRSSNREIMNAAGIIAHQHHEQWNGDGYPNRLSGNEIHIFGRISAIADVFDALICKRCYKAPWAIQDIVAFFSEERGEHFDPLLTDLFLHHIDEFVSIHRAHPDIG